MKKEDIDVTVVGDTLTIAASESTKRKKGRGSLPLRTVFGSISAQLTLPTRLM